MKIKEFTLIEWMVVVAIVFILGAIIAANVVDRRAHAGMHCVEWRVGPPSYIVPGREGGLMIPIENKECVRWEADR